MIQLRINYPQAWPGATNSLILIPVCTNVAYGEICSRVRCRCSADPTPAIGLAGVVVDRAANAQTSYGRVVGVVDEKYYVGALCLYRWTATVGVETPEAIVTLNDDP